MVTYCNFQNVKHPNNHQSREIITLYKECSNSFTDEAILQKVTDLLYTSEDDKGCLNHYDM
jgi:hypothetical protein